MTTPQTPSADVQLIYLDRDDVASLLPPVLEQIDLTESTYVAMARERVELPPKPGIHPRPDSFIHAMPAYLADNDVAAIKWVSGYPGNYRFDLPYLFGLIIVNEAASGRPLAIMDGAEITAARTAAATGVCIRRWAPAGWQRVAVIGAGEQGRYHVPAIRALNPDVSIVAYDPSPGRVATLPGEVEEAADPEAAVRDADVVITLAPIVKNPEPVIESSWLADDCLVLPVDFDASFKLAAIADAPMLVDDIGQFEYYREQGHFQGWPAPQGSVGAAADADTKFPAGRVVCCNLGVGALDAAFSAAVLEAARGTGRGVVLSDYQP